MQTQANEVRELTLAEIPSEFQDGPEMYADSPEGKALRARFRQWMTEQGVYYYARPREEFFLSEGRRLAAEAGCSLLLAEDMS